MSTRDAYRSGTVETPIGDVTVVMAGDRAVAVRVGHPAHVGEQLAREHGIVPTEDAEIARLIAPQLDEYFDGRRRSFDLELDWRFAAPFAAEALRAVCEIPYGETASYGEIAAVAGHPRAARAVGTACRMTPFSVIVPVHRVVRADGSIGEYGGNEHIKRYLVELEHRVVSSDAAGGPAPGTSAPR